jgi:hypothetical protein
VIVPASVTEVAATEEDVPVVTVGAKIALAGVAVAVLDTLLVPIELITETRKS